MALSFVGTCRQRQNGSMRGSLSPPGRIFRLPPLRLSHLCPPPPLLSFLLPLFPTLPSLSQLVRGLPGLAPLLRHHPADRLVVLHHLLAPPRLSCSYTFSPAPGFQSCHLCCLLGCHLPSANHQKSGGFVPSLLHFWRSVYYLTGIVPLLSATI